MCWACWETYGKPIVLNERTRAAFAQLQQLEEIPAEYDGLHIVVDDWNIEDVHIVSSLEKDVKHSPNGRANSPERQAAEQTFLETFLTLTIDERCTVLALDEGLIMFDG